MKADLERPFEAMGARVAVKEAPPRPAVSAWRRLAEGDPPEFGVDVVRGEFRVDLSSHMTAEVVHLDARNRHLLLLLRDGEGKYPYLCGHDERDWFVAAVPGAPASVEEAKHLLMPATVREAKERAPHSKRARRKHQGAVKRQGEWFFVPAAISPRPEEVHRNEPIQRSARSKPHLCEFLYREGGQAVWICFEYPNGVSTADRVQIDRKRAAERRGKLLWQSRTVEAQVYVRGRVTHPDHRPLVLRGWHQVHMNTETDAPHGPSVRFLD